MWLDKLRHGSVQVITNTGTRYVKPSFVEKVRLLWIFRNFSFLPQQVLSVRQQQFLSELSSRPQIASQKSAVRERDWLIGTVVSSVLPPLPHPQERRSQPRCRIQFEVRYGIGKELTSGEGCDIGAAGIGFTGPRSYPPGTEIELYYRMDPDAKWTRVRALVRHCDGPRMGVEILDYSKARLR